MQSVKPELGQHSGCLPLTSSQRACCAAFHHRHAERGHATEAELLSSCQQLYVIIAEVIKASFISDTTQHGTAFDLSHHYFQLCIFMPSLQLIPHNTQGCASQEDCMT